MKLLTKYLALTFVSFIATQAQTLTVRHSFTGGADGANPSAGLIMDLAGNLYGTTYAGGASGNGTIFKVSSSGALTVLHNFGASPDGQGPVDALIMDLFGNLYGTTSFGGTFGYGTVFKLAPAGTLTILYNFTGQNDGAYPRAALTMDFRGNLYGTTLAGGLSQSGTVFKLDRTGNQTVIYSFTGGVDGQNPISNLIVDLAGNLYGTTNSGGASNFGTVFKVSPTGALTTLHNFAGGTDGRNPSAGLILDWWGNFYGTTVHGGASDNGTLFKLKPNGPETVLYSFQGGTDGAQPSAALTLDLFGNIYGTTQFGGGAANKGTVFTFNQLSGAETILHSFTGAADGGVPVASLIFDIQGNLYGVTQFGGSGGGTLFNLKR